MKLLAFETATEACSVAVWDDGRVLERFEIARRTGEDDGALEAAVDKVIDANPDLSFLGPYAWPGDLPDIYGGVDVAWLIDRYQAGQNSDWLLPNRLYEGCLNGAVLSTGLRARRAGCTGAGRGLLGAAQPR